MPCAERERLVSELLLVAVGSYGEALAEVKQLRGTAKFNEAYERAAALRLKSRSRQDTLSQHETSHGCKEGSKARGNCSNALVCTAGADSGACE